MAGQETKPLLGSDIGGPVGTVLGLGDQLFRTYGGAIADTLDAAAGIVNTPIDATLRAAGVNYQFGRPDLSKTVPEPEGIVPQFTRDAAPYVAGSVGAARSLASAGVNIVSRGAQVSAPTTTAVRAAPGAVRTGVAAGAPVDAILSQEQGSNLSNLVEDVGGPTLPTARRPDDSAGEAALKDMAEGGVIGAGAELAIRFFTRGPRAHPGTPEAEIEEAEVLAAVRDPAVQRVLEANGIDETNPRVAEFAARVEARRGAEAARADAPSRVQAAIADVSPPARTAPHAISEADARAALKEILPDAVITSGRRSAEHNGRVGGAPNSWHTRGGAIDLVPPKGTSLSQFRAQLAARGLPITELLDEGDHFHWAFGGGERSPAAAGPGEAPTPPRDLDPPPTYAEMAERAAARTGAAPPAREIPPRYEPATGPTVEVEGPRTLSVETVDRREELARAPNMPPAVRDDIRTVLDGQMDPSRIRTPTRQSAPEVIPVDPQGRADAGDPAIRAATELRGEQAAAGRNLPAVIEQPGPRMTEPQLRQAARRIDAGQPQGAAARGPVYRDPLNPRPNAQLRGHDGPRPRSGDDREPFRLVTYSSENAAGGAPAPGGSPPAGTVAPPARTEVAVGVPPPPAVSLRFGNSGEALAEFSARAEMGTAPAPRWVEGDTAGKASPVASLPAADGGFATTPSGAVLSEAGSSLRFGTATQAANWIVNVGQRRSAEQTFRIAERPGGGFTVTAQALHVRESGGSPRSTIDGPETVKSQAASPDQPATLESPTQPQTRGFEGGEDAPGTQRANVAFRIDGGASSLEVATPSGQPAGLEGSGRAPGLTGAHPIDTAPERGPGAPTESMQRPHPQAEGEAQHLPGGADGAVRYANPLDPELLAKALGKPAADLVRKSVRDTAADAREVRTYLGQVAKTVTPSGAGDAMARVLKTAWVANADRAHAIAGKYPNVPEAQEMADLLGTNPGRGRKIGQTFERAVEMQARSMQNRLRNILGERANPELEGRVADLLAGRRRALSGSAEEAMARRVRTLLDEQHVYLTTAGLETGYVKGRFFPRIIDSHAVLADAAGFQKSAAEVYRKMGLGRQEAEDAALDWYHRILGVSDPTFGSSAMSRHTKGRTLPAEADTLLKSYYVTDAREALSSYFFQTSRSAEFVRRFGLNGEKATSLLNAMRRKGIPPQDVDLLETHYRSVTGQLNATRNGPLQSAAGALQTAGVLALLPRAVISSLSEYFALGVRSHAPVRTSLEIVENVLSDVLSLRGPDHAKDVAEALGIIGDAATDLIISSRFGGEVASQFQQKTLARFFRTTGLHQITEHQRLVGVRIGQRFIASLLDDIAPASKRQASARRLLAELGMGEEETRAVQAWLSQNGGRVPVEGIMGSDPGAKAYRTALQRFVDEAIQNPTAADRPVYANSPVGRLAYGITSFMFSFTRNVLVRTIRETGEAVGGKGYTFEDRVRLASPALGFAILTMVQSQVSELRDLVFNPDQAAERDDIEKTITNLSRAGVFGTLDPFINFFTSAKYERDPTSLMTGPYLTFYAKALSDAVGLLPGLNSPNTNNAEHRAARSSYKAIVAPTAALVASWLPGSGAMRLAYGAGMVSATSSGASHGFADALVGERDGQRKKSSSRDPFDFDSAFELEGQ